MVFHDEECFKESLISKFLLRLNRVKTVRIQVIKVIKIKSFFFLDRNSAVINVLEVNTPSLIKLAEYSLMEYSNIVEKKTSFKRYPKKMDTIDNELIAINKLIEGSLATRVAFSLDVGTL